MKHSKHKTKYEIKHEQKSEYLHFDKKETLSKIIPIVENTAMRYNLIPLEIDFHKENNNWYLKIFIYSNEHSVNIDDCENLTRGISDFLDELIPFKYFLEVSSPGLERKLKSDTEYLIFKGKRAIMKLRNEIEGEKKIEVELLDFDENLGVKILKLDTLNEFTIKKDEIISTQLTI